MAGKKILVLGSGMVAKPCVDYLLRNEENKLTIASRTLAKAESLVPDHPRVAAISLDVSSAELDTAISGHEVVISLVPYVYHAKVVESAIKSKTHVVTTSYVSPAIKELDGPAKAAGITVLNEVGVDPGVDHLYAVKIIGDVHAKGGKVKEFYLYGGGLPAPEVSDNPLEYKDGKVVEVPNEELMARASPYHIKDGYEFLAYPNRNSLPFREFYQIPEAHTVIRGTLRYNGNPQLVKALVDLGWIDSEPKDWLVPGITWAEIQQEAIGSATATETDLIQKIDELSRFSSPSEREHVISGLRWIGLFSMNEAPVHGNLLDTLSAHLAGICSFNPGERDLVVLQHKFVVEWQDGSTNTITSTMELFGDPDGYSAMSRSVGVTCGIATQMLLDGHQAIAKPGIVAPYTKEICDPLREAAEVEGIKLVEKIS
ncbi:putative saccharopine dehydrogenase protein [Eutypa lata UCREL1]|uniref:Putative saccharopine dehydrogenase protein n=1 Tax=Eutypa lata (strain UCR-EL1) TaxID=1287681 RepID=M7SFQ9_EUTLA|nr:putative saccharopine dehydrogenase protein [Eutypa lata UCREL1]